MVSMLSLRASSMNAQVFTTTRSALRRIVGGRHAVGQQGADQLVAVDLVLGAAQGLDVEALAHDRQATGDLARGS